MANPRVVVDFVADTSALQNSSEQLGRSGSRAGQLLHRAFVPAVATLGAIAVGAGKAIQAASNLNEQISASVQVFGKHAKGVQDWAKTGATAFGLSQTEALKAANAYGNMFTTVGLGQGDVTKMSKSMVQLAGDMASFHDQDPSDMLERLQSGLAGEAEPLRKFGVLLSEAAVQQEAVRMGLSKTGKNLTEAQKVQARYSLIMQQTTKAQGDFARTGDSVANQQRTLAAENENLAASFGQALLPITSAFMKQMQAVLGVIGENRTVLTVLIGVVTALAAVIVVTNGAVAAWNAITMLAKAATAAWTAAQWLLNAALAANPIALVIIAIAALVAAFIVAYKTSDTFRNIVDTAFNAVLSVAQTLFNWLKANWPLLLGIITGPIGLATIAVIRNWDTIQGAVTSAVNAVRSAVTTAWNAVRSATNTAWDAVSGAVADASSAVKSALNSLATWISGFAHGALSVAVHAAQAVFDFIADGARDAYASVQRNLNGMVDFIEGIVGKVSHAASSVANAIKAPINAVIDAWNGLSIPRVSIRLPAIKIKGHKIFGGGNVGFGPFPFPDMPHLARGGVLDQPTLAVVGEGQGREIVAPESLLREIMAERAVQVRVFIGATELTDLVRTEIVDANTGLARSLLAG